MSRFWLNTSQVLSAARVAETKFIKGELVWYYCPNCLWVGVVQPDWHPARSWCPRYSTHERNTLARCAAAHRTSTYQLYGEDCDVLMRDQAMTGQAFPQDMEAALWAAYRLGGTNAVLQMLSEYRPEHLGLLPYRDVLDLRRRRRCGG